MNLTDYTIQLPVNPIGKLHCVDLLDFKDYPILTHERNDIGQDFVSYLVKYLANGQEERILAGISATRLLDMCMGTLSVRQAFQEPVSGPIYAFHTDEETGEVREQFMITASDFQKINPIPDDYNIYKPPITKEASNAAARTLAIAKDRHRVVMDFELQGESLSAGVRPWTITGVFQPFLGIIQQALNLRATDFNKVVSFPRLQANSFDVTIELDYSLGLFDGEIEFTNMASVIDLLSARTGEEFHTLVSHFKTQGFVTEYLRIINSVRKYDLNLSAILANPVNELVKERRIDKKTAEEIREVINATFDTMTETETVNGVFLDLNFSVRDPSFVIRPTGEEVPIRGKIDPDIIKRLRGDRVNLSRDTYNFDIRTIYQPETSVRPETTQRWLVDYRENGHLRSDAAG